MAYIGNQPTDNFVTFATQNFSTSATSSYTLDHAVSNENEIALFINNVRQHPGSGKAYTATGTALTLSENTASTDVMYCIFLGRAIQSTVPSTNSITADMIGNTAISGKDALASEPADTDEFLVSDAGVLKRIDYSLIKGGGKILQVVQTTKTDTFTSGSSNAWIDVTGLSAAITPASTSNKILVHLTMGIVSISSANSFGFKLVRGSTDISIGDAGSSRKQSSIWNYDGASNRAQSEACSFLDSPSSTSEQTYKVQMYANDTAYVNRMSGDSDNDTYGRTASSIILMEVSA